LYFNATGSVIRCVPEQLERVLYYALVMKGTKDTDPPLPVAELISNKHAVPDITNFLVRVIYALHKKNKKFCLPQKAVGRFQLGDDLRRQ
jgi:hypothetical protein